MDDPNITMEEYIRLEEEKAQKRRKVFNWKLLSMVRSDETSWSEYDEEEQNVLYYNDLFPFNIIYPDDLKSDKGDDDNEIDMIQSSGDMVPLPPREERRPFLRYQGLEYSNQDIVDFKERLERIQDRGTHRVQVLDFEGMPELMRDVLYARMRMEHRDGDGVVVFTSQAWGRDLATKKLTKLVKYQSSGILFILEYLVKINKKARFLSLKQRYLKIYNSDTKYAVSIKEDTAYL
ncbi:hypothetical protein Tco_0408205 [Tanacetum coccineum]